MARVLARFTEIVWASRGHRALAGVDTTWLLRLAKVRYEGVGGLTAPPRCDGLMQCHLRDL